MYVGLDISLNGTGLAVVCPGQMDVFETYRLSPPDKLIGVDRLLNVERQMLSIFDQWGTPTYAAVENYTFGNSTGQYFHIGEMGGVLKLCLFKLGVPFYLVNVSHVKEYVTGNGGADKYLIGLEIGRQLQIRIPNDDEADAFSLAQILAHIKEGNSLFAISDHEKCSVKSKSKLTLGEVRANIIADILANPFGLPKKKGRTKK